MIRLITAIDQGNTLGWADGRLAYPDLKLDMKRFRELTLGDTVVMGFNTFKSLNRPNGLPDRRTVVLTRKDWSTARQFIGDGISDIVSDLDWVVRDAKRRQDITWICGGGSVYDEALSKGIVNEIYLTLIQGSSDADVKLKTDLAAWKLFILQQRKLGINWEPIVCSPEQDGNHTTTFIHLRRT